MIDVTKFTAPFGLLDEVYGPGAQEALKAWPHGIVWYAGAHGLWTECRRPMWASSSTYRGLPAPLTKPSIDWSQVAPRWVAMAMDESGMTLLHDTVPSVNGASWRGPCGYRHADTVSSFVPGTCDWKDSLVRRPEGV